MTMNVSMIFHTRRKPMPFLRRGNVFPRPEPIEFATESNFKVPTGIFLSPSPSPIIAACNGAAQDSSNTMALSRLPNELLLLLISHIHSEADFASLAQANRRLYKTLIPYLYQRNARNSQGSALLYAAEYGRLSTAKKAVEAGVDVNMKTPPPEERSLLGVAAIGGNVAVVQFLLDNAADITARDNMRTTPLFLAASYGQASVVKLLLDRGVDANIADRARRTPLYIASLCGHRLVVDLLLAHEGVLIEAPDTAGETALGAAARQGHASVVEALLAHGAHAGVRRSRACQPPLHSAMRRGQADVLRLLVNRGDVDPNVISQDLTPLQVAVQANRADLAEILLTDPRVNPDLSVLVTGQTPLLWAAIKNHDRMVQLLLEAGANPRIMDRTWLSPAMVLEAPSAEARLKLLTGRSLCRNGD